MFSAMGKSRVAAAVALAATVTSSVIVGRKLAGQPDALDVRVSHRLVKTRVPVCDRVAVAVSWSTDVPRAIATTAALGLATYLKTRDARAALTPIVGACAASGMHVTSSWLVDRPRPDVPRLGTTQPTSSYPSGHVGAVTAQAIWLSRAAKSLPPRSRKLVRFACVAFPTTVAWSRLYLGQHFLTDVLAGVANGVVAANCAPALVGATARDTHQPGTTQ